jgi:transcriptional regulator with XRE-family HTH domain
VGKPLVRLRELRQQRAWSLADVAFELGRVAQLIGDSLPGADANTVSRWERGISAPTKFYVRLLCLVFEALPQDLGLAARPLLLHELEQARRRLEEAERTSADREHDQKMENALLRAPAGTSVFWGTGAAGKTRMLQELTANAKDAAAPRSRGGRR